MIQFHLPQLNYILFQLLSYDNNEDSPNLKEEMVIPLTVIPTMLDYNLTSRDAVYQTTGTIFTDKFPIAPVRCSLSGNFGVLPRAQKLNLIDGFGRLK